MSAQSEKPKQHFNARVANQLAQQLRDGDAPMQRPGVQDIPYNPATGRTFHGINALNLMMQGRQDDRWFTFDDANLNGYKVKSGEKATPVQYWPKKQPGETVSKAITVYVFNAEQLDRMPPPPSKPKRQDPMERVTELLRGSGITVVHDQVERSFYAPRKDDIHSPKPETCASPEKYCEMAIYECFKASGHPSRQDRETFNAVGASDRAKEELVCTVATMMYCAEVGISHNPNRNPELAQAERDADNAVWGTLRQEQARDIALGLRQNEVWRPVPDASPAVAVESFLNRNAALELAAAEPWKTHGLEYEGQQLYAVPEAGSIVSKRPGEDGNETHVTARIEAYDRAGNAYNVLMECTAVIGEDGQKRLTNPAQAVDIAPAVKSMSLPMDWNGTLEVRGCIEDILHAACNCENSIILFAARSCDSLNCVRP